MRKIGTIASVTAADRTKADPTRLVNEDEEGANGRAVLLVYADVGTGQRTKIVELPDGSDVSFGRSRKSTVHIDTDGVSRSHCILKRRDTSFQIEDLNSRNGTRVNGEKITKPTELESGDEISLGPVTVVLSVTSAIRSRRRLGSTAYLNERLNGECDRGHRYGRPMALLMIRLEGEDSKVDAAVERLAGRMRSMDTLCEYSPDELAVIVPEVNQAAAEQLADRLAREAKSVLGSQPDKVRVGIALFPAHGTSPDELVGNARAALQTARSQALPISAPPKESSDSSVIVHSPQMKKVYELVDKIAASDITLLIYGETGSGKEIVAGSVHQKSARATQPYLRLNCASIPETLLESELFGHEKGSFTGADKRKLGYFEAAQGGTIFLDEIGEISANVQAKLLRVLESRSITRVGGTAEIEVDVRIVCATNRDLDVEIREGRFREDLFYRISAFSLVVPPLRDRKTDIMPLCEHFLRLSSTQLNQDNPVLSPAVRRCLNNYDWPGNVRQLRNAMERSVVLASDGVVEAEDLPDRIREAARHSSAAAPIVVGDDVDVRDTIADVEKAAIENALEAVNGNQTKAAKRLGLSRRALIYKLEKYGLKEPPASRRKS